MTSTASKPVIVGIDGSESAEEAALWAVDEAAGRAVPLHLMYVVRTDLTGTLSAQEYRTTLEDAKHALHSARGEVAATGRPVEVSTEIAHGFPAGVLEAASRDASLICLGASGIGRVGQAMLGSTATLVAERAACPVAIIRSRDARTANPVTHWVMVPVSVFTDASENSILAAVSEARLRDRPILAVGVWHPEFGATPYEALECMTADWQRRFPDLRIYSVPNDTSMSRFLRDHADLAGIAVVDATDSRGIAAVISRESHVDGAERAVLVARAHADWPTLPVAAARC